MYLLKDVFKSENDFIGKKIEIGGWIKNSRFNNNIGFIEINDGTTFKNVQVVVESSISNFTDISKLFLSTAIIVKGKVVESQGSKQNFEINATEIIVEGKSSEKYPLQKKRHTFEFLRTIQHLRPRTNTFNAVYRVRSVLSYAIHKFFFEKGFVYAHTPIITSSDSEGAGEMFKVTTLDLNNIPKTESGEIDFSNDFFSKSTNLTVSGQLQGEAFAHTYRNIYTFGPTFRAENSNTTRHASEFWMMEPEIAFAELKDVINLSEEMVKYIINFVLENAPDEMKFFNDFIDNGLLERLNSVVNSEFKVMTYTEAIDILKDSKEKFKYPVNWGVDLKTEHERYICEKIVKGPVFLINYPKEIKAFYMRLNDDGKTVAAMDMLVPGIGELIGGSQREERLDILIEKMKESGMNPDDYSWYLDLRRYGGTKHGGYGLGFERMLMYITGMQNIRDVLPFPRTVGLCEF